MAKKITQNQIVLENFMAMHPELPQYTPKNQHNYIGGDLLYFKTLNSFQTKAYPLCAAGVPTPALQSGFYPSGGHFTRMISGYGAYDVAYTDNNGNVYLGKNDNSVLLESGYTVAATEIVDLCFKNSLLVYALNNNSNIYYWDLTTAQPAAATVYAPGINNVSNHLMASFQQFLMLTDGAAVSDGLNTNRRILKITLEPAQSSVLGIDLGLGWIIQKLQNYQDKFLAIFAVVLGGGHSTERLFLWDGISATYNYSIALPGNYIDGLVVGNILYVLVQSGVGNYSLYYLNGQKFKKITDLRNYGVIPTFSNNRLLSSFGNYLIVNSLGKLLFFADGLIFSPLINSPIDVATVFAEGVSTSTIFLSAGNALNKISYPPTAGSYISYNSQPIDFGRQVSIAGIEVFYNSTPRSGNDNINMTLNYRDENQPSAVSYDNFNAQISLKNITPTNYDTSVRTYLDAGIQCSVLSVNLGAYSDSGWLPFIDKIIIYYD